MRDCWNVNENSAVGNQAGQSSRLDFFTQPLGRNAQPSRRVVHWDSFVRLAFHDRIMQTDSARKAQLSGNHAALIQKVLAPSLALVW